MNSVQWFWVVLMLALLLGTNVAQLVALAGLKRSLRAILSRLDRESPETVDQERL